MNPSEVLTRMLNSYSASWEITQERIEALMSIMDMFPGEDHSYLFNMVEEARTTSEWQVTPERIFSVRTLVVLSSRPTPATIKNVVMQIRAGASADGVQDRPWVRAAIKLLEDVSSIRRTA